MRVTNKMSSDTITKELYKNQQLLLEAQLRLSTGKKINRVSDDPSGMRRVLDYRRILSSIDQYNNNISHGKGRLQVTETALEEIVDSLKQAKTLAIRFGSNQDPDKAQELIESIYETIMDIGNTRFGDSYIFAGNAADTVPFTKDENWDATYHGDDGDITVIVEDGVEVKTNATGQDVFDVGGVGGGVDVFAALSALRDAIIAGDHDAAMAQSSVIESAIDQVETIATETSIYYGRLESSENHLELYKANIEDMRSSTENIDTAQAILEFQSQETAYTVCLETASRMIQPSLIDFLK
ncbi:putative Flagellar hook-associated protein 3 [uncultured Desulfobacterium sp.]|uniref:Putative Flagellar hook-associated protein 3 n=1 Tax=uncultured Desulfobacterium sp. TaxID=201089 RepID=A0A445MT79_9BACT|nr:putative Flagellar hook-associated protein 3 [uncultured Desulfobacterium sp.]